MEGYDWIVVCLRFGFGGGGNWVCEILFILICDDVLFGGVLFRVGIVFDFVVFLCYKGFLVNWKSDNKFISIVNI